MAWALLDQIRERGLDTFFEAEERCMSRGTLVCPVLLWLNFWCKPSWLLLHECPALVSASSFHGTGYHLLDTMDAGKAYIVIPSRPKRAAERQASPVHHLLSDARECAR